MLFKEIPLHAQNIPKIPQDVIVLNITLAFWKQRHVPPLVNDKELNEGGNGNKLRYRHI